MFGIYIEKLLKFTSCYILNFLLIRLSPVPHFVLVLFRWLGVSLSVAIRSLELYNKWINWSNDSLQKFISLVGSLCFTFMLVGAETWFATVKFCVVFRTKLKQERIISTSIVERFMSVRDHILGNFLSGWYKVECTN